MSKNLTGNLTGMQMLNVNPLTPTVATRVTAMKHPVPEHPVSDRVKPSFVIFDNRALWRLRAEPQSARMSKKQMTA